MTTIRSRDTDTNRDFRTEATELRKTREDNKTRKEKYMFWTHPTVPGFSHAPDPGLKACS